MFGEFSNFRLLYYDHCQDKRYKCLFIIFFLSRGSIQVIFIVIFQVPMEEEQRVDVINIILAELQNNIMEAANSISNDTSVQIITRK